MALVCKIYEDYYSEQSSPFFVLDTAYVDNTKNECNLKFKNYDSCSRVLSFIDSLRSYNSLYVSTHPKVFYKKFDMTLYPSFEIIDDMSIEDSIRSYNILRGNGSILNLKCSKCYIMGYDISSLSIIVNFQYASANGLLGYITKDVEKLFDEVLK